MIQAMIIVLVSGVKYRVSGQSISQYLLRHGSPLWVCSGVLTLTRDQLSELELN